MSDHIDMTVLSRNGRATVFVRGEIDMSSGPLLRDALSTAQQGSPHVIVDVSDVTFMDSTGINVLIGAYHQTPEGGSLAVLGARPAVRRVFDLTGVSELLMVESQEQTALPGPFASEPGAQPQAV